MSISGQQRHGLEMTKQTVCLTQITPEAILKPRSDLLDSSVLVTKNEVWEKFVTATFF
jgi:hypothetical protein